MYWFSDRVALRVSCAQPLERAAAPEIHADVEDLAQRAGLPVPRLYVIPSSSPTRTRPAGAEAFGGGGDRGFDAQPAA